MASALETIAVLVNRRPTVISYSNQKTDPDQTPKLTSITLDACVNETHTISNDITSHPVESGADITDHIHQNPTTLRIEGIITNTPTRFPEAVPGLSLARSVENLVRNVSNDLAVNAFNEFEKIIENNQLITISTSLKNYEDMLIENFTVTRDAQSTDMLRFTCTARQIRIVRVDLIEPATPEVKAQKVKQGKKANKPVSDSVSQQSTSFANSISEYGFDYISAVGSLFGL